MAEAGHASQSIDEPQRLRARDGEEYDVVGRAGPVERGRRPPYIHAEAREDVLVAKSGPLFLCARPDGNIVPGVATGEGLYASDTRFLSELRVLLAGAHPVLLSSSTDARYAAVVDATNAEVRIGESVVVSQQTLNVERYMVVSDRLYVAVTLRNFGDHAVETELELTLGADFADMFEVRGHPYREHRGHLVAPKQTDTGVCLAYVGQDDLLRETVVRFEPQPSRTDVVGQRVEVAWPMELDRAGEASIVVSVEPRPVVEAGPTRPVKVVAARNEEERRAWLSSCTAIESDNELFGQVLEAAVRDLHALMTPVENGSGGEINTLAAGVPWFVALFGRDSLIACQEALILNPALARDNLRLLAGFQATEDDAWRDAEPGKILHELRTGELARAGLIPHTPYYGTIDATPLFLMLAGSYFRWTGDLETMSELRPALDAALVWIDEYGDRDGDGFLEYATRSPSGLLNQGWKDSDDCIVHVDGSLAEGPIALVEVQGYAYLAKLRIAAVYEAFGEADRARALRAEAHALREAFNDAFWDPDEASFVLALDGRKQQVRSVTSNAGHALYCGIADADKAPFVAERLMAPDMFCGWGIRTLSDTSPAFNPMSYHNGSVWPHDNAICAAGLKRYGLFDLTERIATALFDVAASLRDHRLPELYCGFGRGERRMPVAYPVACSPQAWASAVPFFLLQAMLGISARAHDNVLTVIEPRLPEWLGSVSLNDLCVHASRVSLSFRREGGTTTFSLREQQGDVQVLLSA